VSRFDIGLVIATGLGIGTLFTLFVVPAAYVKLARSRTAAAPEAGAEVEGEAIGSGR
jgi:multidrug efflux pump